MTYYRKNKYYVPKNQEPAGAIEKQAAFVTGQENNQKMALEQLNSVRKENGLNEISTRRFNRNFLTKDGNVDMKKIGTATRFAENTENRRNTWKQFGIAAAGTLASGIGMLFDSEYGSNLSGMASTATSDIMNATQQMDELRKRLEKLEKENEELKKKNSGTTVAPATGAVQGTTISLTGNTTEG